MRRKSFLFLIFLLFSLPAKADEVLLQEVVEKLIIDVHNLKLKVAELEAKLGGKRKVKSKKRNERCKTSSKHNSIKHNNIKQNSIKHNIRTAGNKVEVIRGELVKNRKSCRLATVKKVTEKGKGELLSLLPEEAPLYVREFKGNYVYLTLPEYCEAVKEKIEDASVTRIHIE